MHLGGHTTYTYTHAYTYTCTFTHDSTTHIHPTFYTLLHTLLSRTSLRHTFFCTRRSFTISFLFPAFPIPSSPFFGCLLEEVGMWVL